MQLSLRLMSCSSPWQHVPLLIHLHPTTVLAVCVLPPVLACAAPVLAHIPLSAAVGSLKAA